MAGDTYWQNVSLLLKGDGANGSTTFTDNSPTPKTPTVFGNTQISTTQSKWGGASALFDGNGDYLTYANHTDFNLISGDWTIEAWIYITTLTAAAQTLLDKDGVSGSSYPQYSLAVSSAAKLVGFLGNGNGVSPTGTTYTGTTTITQNAWHHVALVKTGSTCKGFLDGNQEWSAAAATMYSGSKALFVGWSSGQPVGTYFNGHVDDLRITKGVARYTASFTPPTAAFIDGMGQVSGVIRDSANALCARTVRLIRRDTGALLSSTVSDASTGVYSLPAPTLDEVQRIVLDDSGGTLYNDIIDRVIPA